MNSTVIIRSENGTVTYVVGEVVSKTQEQIQNEIAELEAKIANRVSVDVDSIKEEYAEKIRLLNEEMEAAVAKAITDNEAANIEAQKDAEALENLKVVLDTFAPAEPTTEEVPVNPSI